MKRVACCVVLAALATACSGGGDKKSAGSEAEVTPGGGSTGIAGGSLLSIDPSAAGGSPGLSVRGAASGTVPADLAFVVVVPPGGGIEALGESSITPQDRKKVVDGLAGIGVARGDVAFEADPLGLGVGGVDLSRRRSA
jgi:hypothetical protein